MVAGNNHGDAFLTSQGIDLDVDSSISSSVSSDTTPIIEPKNQEEIDQSKSNNPAGEKNTETITQNSKNETFIFA